MIMLTIMKKLLLIIVLCGMVLTGNAQTKATREHRELIKQHIYSDYKQMFKQPTGIALKYPYITPGSRQYAAVLWDWDSWLSNVALRQILNDIGCETDKAEALAYEQGCVLNYLAYTSPDDGYMPMVVDAETDPDRIKPSDIYSTNMHKPCLAQHAAFLIRENGGEAEWIRQGFGRMQALYATIMSIIGIRTQDCITGRTTWR